VGDKSTENLPEYESPPLTEVVCGILFEPLEKFIGPYLGLLWEEYREEFPTTQEAPPITPTIELFERVTPPEPITNDLLQFLPRTWFIHKDDTRVIQVQRDRFLYNWRKVKPEDQYPRYHEVMRGFQHRYDQFLEFLNEHQIGAVKSLQYELTYVNHIPAGTGWNTTADIGKVFPDITWRTEEARFLPLPEAVNWRTSFTLPNMEGRLHVSLRSGEQAGTHQPVLLLDLTARGIPSTDSQEAMKGWFDQAREWIVRGFSDITGTDVQRHLWVRQR
jgi:uncharacterized protein (TIGR04255 family)